MVGSVPPPAARTVPRHPSASSLICIVTWSLLGAAKHVLLVTLWRWDWSAEGVERPGWRCGGPDGRQVESRISHTHLPP